MTAQGKLRQFREKDQSYTTLTWPGQAQAWGPGAQSRLNNGDAFS